MLRCSEPAIGESRSSERTLFFIFLKGFRLTLVKENVRMKET